MTGRQVGASRDDMLRLLDGGSTAGLDDGELLARFAARRDEAAFEALVARLGPMVLGVCRRMLADPRDAEDAFQATFLVLARRAGAIRDRELLAPWLHGVALRVGRRARAVAARRASRERLGQVVDVPEAAGSGSSAEWSEVRAGIDEEIGRLPESHRRLVVLCDVEGLSREEAAARLGWTANMVRGRLERARGRLRDRLTRRGLSPSGAYLALAMPAAPPRAALAASTIRGALALLIGRSTGIGPAAALSEGVARMMMLAKWKLGATALVSAGAMMAGSGMLAARQGAGDGPPAAKAAVGPSAAMPPGASDVDVHGFKYPGSADLLTAAGRQFQPRPAAELRKARVDAAKARYEAQAAFYQEGRITVDRVIDASRSLMETEIAAPSAKADRVAAARAHHARLDQLLRREQAELEVGRATTADVNEVNSGLLEAEFALAREIEAAEPKPARSDLESAIPAPSPPRGAVDPIRLRHRSAAELARARVEGARARYDALTGFYRDGKTTVDRVVATSRALMEAERDAAGSKAERMAALRAHRARLDDLLRREKAEIEAGNAADIAEVEAGVLEADYALAKEIETPGPPAVEPASPGSGGDAEAGTKPRADSLRRMLGLPEGGGHEGTTAGRLAALLGEQEGLEDLLKKMEASTAKDDETCQHIQSTRLRLINAQIALRDYVDRLEVPVRGGDGAPDAVIPSADGKLPTTRPADPSAGPPSVSLAEAVAAFNRLGDRTPGGKSEPPMTEDEVIAAIKHWRPDRETTVIRDGVFTNLTPPGAPVGAFKAIAETRQLPPGAALALSTERDAGEDFLYDGWFIVLSVPSADGRLHDFPIRSRLTRLISLDEAQKRVDPQAGPAPKGGTRPILERHKKIAR